MKWLSLCAGEAAVIALTAPTAGIAADPYPVRPVRIIVNSGPGGLVDLITRLVAQ